jgi:hypothetical protein
MQRTKEEGKERNSNILFQLDNYNGRTEEMVRKK